MQDAAFPAVHGVEAERDAAALHPLGRRQRAQPQLFDAQHAVIVGVEAQPGVILRSHLQHLHRQQLERQQKLGFVREEQLDIRPRELHHHIRILEIGMAGLAFADLEFELEAGFGHHLAQELVRARLDSG